tara:strand:- start:197 stop:841 length:645 start_codon:yes stop_codon:yes gene_type:complete
MAIFTGTAAAATALAAKFGIGAKLASAFGAAKGMIGLNAAKQLAIPGLMGAAKAGGTRMAGGKLAGLGTKMLGGLKAAVPRTMDDAALMIGPDVLFGGIAGAMTPGDLGDKLIAGTSTAVGGAVGGIGVRGALGGVAPKMMATKPYMQMGAELVGGMGGDIAAQGVADNILRVKGGGTTPYEKMAADQQKELEQQILQQYLSGKGGYPMGNGMV